MSQKQHIVSILVVMSILLCGCTDSNTKRHQLDNSTLVDDVQLIYHVSWSTPDDWDVLSETLKISERTAVDNELLQNAAETVSHGQNVASVARISALSWAIAPSLPPVNGSTPEWIPHDAELLGEDIWRIRYLDLSKCGTLIEESYGPGNNVFFADSGIFVYISSRDGHVVLVTDSWGTPILEEKTVLEEPAPAVTHHPHLIKYSFQEHFSFQDELALHDESYRYGINGSDTIFPDDYLANKTAYVFLCFPPVTPEMACEYAWKLADLLKEKGYLPEDWIPIGQHLFTDGVCEFVFAPAIRGQVAASDCMNTGQLISVLVYVSQADGHVIAIRNTVGYMTWENVEPIANTD